MWLILYRVVGSKLTIFAIVFSHMCGVLSNMIGFELV